jgi:hypothetical protein
MNGRRDVLVALAPLGVLASPAGAAARLLAQAQVPSPAAGPPAAPPAPEPDPGLPASPDVVQEIHALVGAAMQRFHAKDAAGVLAHVSESYRTGLFTKSVVRTKLQTIFGFYDAVQVRVRIDAVRMVGEHAWIFSTGEISGRVRLLGSWADVLWWDRELEIVRRENGVWRLYGYQQ